jgi:hypothetical protein
VLAEILVIYCSVATHRVVKNPINFIVEAIDQTQITFMIIKKSIFMSNFDNSIGYLYRINGKTSLQCHISLMLNINHTHLAIGNISASCLRMLNPLNFRDVMNLFMQFFSICLIELLYTFPCKNISSCTVRVFTSL